MVETYGVDEQRFYYIEEATFGTTPATTPAMLGVPHDLVDPEFDPDNILIRGAGNFDLEVIKKGVRKPSLRVGYVLPSAAPIELLQHAKIDLNDSLSCQLLYFKGAFATATDIISLMYVGMRIAKASVSCDIEDVVRAVLDFEGQDLVAGTAKLTDATYTDHGGAVAFHESYVKKDTTTLDRVVSWKFDINNNPRRVPVIRSSNGHLAKYIPFGKRDLSGEVVFEFESKTEMDEALSDTEFDLEFGLGGTCKAVFPDCKWKSVTHSKWLEDLISAKATFDCKGPLAISTGT
jgi:hypothetical protein